MLTYRAVRRGCQRSRSSVGLILTLLVAGATSAAAQSKPKFEPTPPPRTETGTNVVTIRGTVRSRTMPLPHITVKIVPHKKYGVSRSRVTSGDGTFAIHVPRDTEWQEVDVLLLDHKVYRSHVARHQLSLDAIGFLDLEMEPIPEKDPTAVAGMLDDFQQLLERGGDTWAVQMGLDVVMALYPDQFGPTSPLSAKVDLITEALLSHGTREVVIVNAELPFTATMGIGTDPSGAAMLPLLGREYSSLMLLSPGVRRDTRSIDVAGQRGTLNSFVVDGADYGAGWLGERAGTGLASYYISQEAIEGLVVKSSEYNAETRFAVGANVQVSTKSGTNVFRGSSFEFYRDKALNANNAVNARLGRATPASHANQFGIALGGPLQVNRHFIFGG